MRDNPMFGHLAILSSRTILGSQTCLVVILSQNCKNYGVLVEATSVHKLFAREDTRKYG